MDFHDISIRRSLENTISTRPYIYATANKLYNVYVIYGKIFVKNNRWKKCMILIVLSRRNSRPPYNIWMLYLNTAILNVWTVAVLSLALNIDFRNKPENLRWTNEKSRCLCCYCFLFCYLLIAFLEGSEANCISFISPKCTLHRRMCMLQLLYLRWTAATYSQQQFNRGVK